MRKAIVVCGVVGYEQDEEVVVYSSEEVIAMKPDEADYVEESETGYGVDVVGYAKEHETGEFFVVFDGEVKFIDEMEM